jgi:hypothetical protein
VLPSRRGSRHFRGEYTGADRVDADLHSGSISGCHKQRYSRVETSRQELGQVNH